MHRFKYRFVVILPIVFSIQMAGAQVNWTIRNAIPAQPDIYHHLNSVTWAVDKFVAVGSHGIVLTSADSVNWTIQSTGTTQDLNAITWTGTRLVAVGSGGMVLTSSNGRDWVFQSSGTTENLLSIIWTEKMLFAVGGTVDSNSMSSGYGYTVWGNGIVLTSPDGITWTDYRVNQVMRSVVWNGNQAFAIGGNLCQPSIDGPSQKIYQSDIYSSPDGETWTKQTGINGSYFISIAWTGTQLFAVDTRGLIYTSPEGKSGTWVHDTAISAPHLSSIFWIENRLIGFTNDSSGKIYTSPESQAWSRCSSNVSKPLRSVASNGTMYVAVGDDSTLVTSIDGNVWIERLPHVHIPPPDPPDPVTTNQLYSVAWDGKKIVVVGDNGIVLTSTDGITWEKQISNTGAWLSSIAWTGNRFFAVGEGGVIVFSPDGMGWNTVRVPTDSIALRSIASNGAISVAVGFDKAFRLGAVFFSTDGITWTQRFPNTQKELFSVTWAGDKFIAVGASGIIITSTDGIDWTLRQSGIGSSLFSVTWTGAKAVAVGKSGEVVVSEDGGETWSEYNTGVKRPDSLSVIWSGSELVAVGTDGSVLTSPDGRTWMEQSSGTTAHLASVTLAGNQFVAVGAGGVILTSPNENFISILPHAAPSQTPPILGLRVCGNRLVVTVTVSMTGRTIHCTCYSLLGRISAEYYLPILNGKATAVVRGFNPGIHQFAMTMDGKTVAKRLMVLR
ncbi:MAG: hypothetical protein JW863_12130 [Chitinispirillaceae bacterium]|nr:hypothetical protein [Chitinispirillaceae bacterium]